MEAVAYVVWLLPLATGTHKSTLYKDGSIISSVMPSRMFERLKA